jgi:hypothetical protein
LILDQHSAVSNDFAGSLQGSHIPEIKTIHYEKVCSKMQERLLMQRGGNKAVGANDHFFGAARPCL